MLREHRQQQQQQLATGNSTTTNHTEQKEIVQEFSDRNARPESRNRVVAYQSFSRTSSNDRTTDQVDTGLLAVVDQKSTGQSTADPLVSLIQSLADISPVRSPPSVTNKIENDHHTAGIGAAATTPASSNVPNNISTNCSPNQSPKAWQSCTQVCPCYQHTLPRCSLLVASLG